jgi:hypothetical protein
MPFQTCAQAAASLALKQGKLKKCDGTDLPDGTQVATCADLASVAPNLKNCAGVLHAAGANVPACSEIPALVTANETTTTVVETPGQKTWSYNNEDATTKVMNNSQIVSANAGNAIAIGADGGLMLSIPAQLPDDQVLSGDNTGTVALTLTPVVVGDQTNYTIKADLKVAATTPDSETNLLQSSPSGFYVDADSVMTAIAGDTTAKATLIAAIPLATTTVAGLIEEATGEETRLGATDPNKDDRAVTPGSMSYTLQTGLDYPIKIVRSAGDFRRSINGSFDSGTANMGSGWQDAPAVLGYLSGGVTVPTGETLTSVCGRSIAAGDGRKIGTSGFVDGPGGTNIGVYGHAFYGTTNWAAYLDGNVAGGAYTTLSDATLKENVEAIDPVKALQFRNGLSWKKYEMFSEQQVQIMQDVTDSEGNTTQVPTGRYEVKRSSQGIKRGLIAQEVLALAQSIGDFTDVVVEVGEYFTLDDQGYPVKDADGNNIVNKRFGLDYDAINFIVMAAEQHDSRISMKQARLALLQAGLLDTVEGAIADADKATQIDWEYSNFLDPKHQIVNTLVEELGITKEQFDSLIALAKTL